MADDDSGGALANAARQRRLGVVVAESEQSRAEQGGHETFMHLGTLCISRASKAGNEAKSKALLMVRGGFFWAPFMRLALAWLLV